MWLCGGREDHLQRKSADGQAQADTGCQLIAPGTGGQDNMLRKYFAMRSLCTYHPVVVSEQGQGGSSVPVGCAMALGSSGEGASRAYGVGLSVTGAIAAS